MSLRNRLVVVFLVLLVASVVVVGTVVVYSSRSVLTAPIDDELERVRTKLSPEKSLTTTAFQKSVEKDGLEIEAMTKGEAIVILDIDGSIAFAQPSGSSDDPDPLPNIDHIPMLVDDVGIKTIPSENGQLNFRAFGFETESGDIGVWAIPLDDVDTAMTRIYRAVLVTSAIVAVLGGASTWWMVRRGLRPVDQMIDTASAIGIGDLTRRIPDAVPSTELGKLSAALNNMLTQIETSFAREQIAGDRLKHFVADASHELRTPIAAIKGYTDLYQKGMLEHDSDLDRAMRRIGTESSRMKRLVDDLLLLARLDQEPVMERRTVDLAAVVHDAINDSHAINPERRIDVEVDEPVRMQGDEQLLMQVVANLLANARTHTPQGTPVIVTLRENGVRATLDVVDEGPGFPVQGADRLFERFSRPGDNSSGRNAGTGLGLAIVSAIATAHGGTVKAANIKPHGSRFTVELPLRE